MNGERRSCTERILAAIDYGKLPNKETEGRLRELVEAEVNKTDSEADMELIKACQSLMWQLHTHGELPYDSHCDENKLQIDQRIRHNVMFSSTVKSVSKVLAVAAAVVLVVLGLRGDLHWNWLEHDDSLDHQQHIIRGNEIAIELIQQAIADYEELGVLQFGTIEELSEHFGFLPISETIGQKWHFVQAVSMITPEMIRMDAQYLDVTTDHSLIYTVVLFTNADDAYLTFEQSSTGSKVRILDQTVYVTDNLDRMNMCWTQGLALVRITGDFSQSEGSTILKYILQEWLQ